IRAELARVFGEERANEQLRRYHELEPELEADGRRSYREVMMEAMRRLGAPAGEESGLAQSLPGWQPFPEVRTALEEARERGWKLAILSNTDADFIAASKQLLGVPFDETVVAGEIGSYNPAPGHWTEITAQTGTDPSPHIPTRPTTFPDTDP